jgi:hypothetical protein
MSAENTISNKFLPLNYVYKLDEYRYAPNTNPEGFYSKHIVKEIKNEEDFDTWFSLFKQKLNTEWIVFVLV